MKTVGVTDDDPGLQDILVMILERAGYEVVLIDGRDLKKKHRHPDLYILDKQLSGLDGLDLCKYLKKNSETSAIPIIMVSATPGIGAMSVLAGADGFIEKPFNKNDLLTAVSDHLNHYLH